MRCLALSVLEPKLTENQLVFDCPKCETFAPHRIVIALNKSDGSNNGHFWQAEGTLENLTVKPSIACDVPQTPDDNKAHGAIAVQHCGFHGFITDGSVLF